MVSSRIMTSSAAAAVMFLHDSNEEKEFSSIFLLNLISSYNFSCKRDFVLKM